MAKSFDLGVLDVFGSSQSSTVDEEEMVALENSAVPMSTSRATKSGVKKFENWLRKRSIDVDPKTISSKELAHILRRFYAELKKKDGKASLTPSSLVGIRAALARYFNSAPFYRNFNIVSGSDFIVANKMFDPKCKLYYKEGNSKPKHKPTIEK